MAKLAVSDASTRMEAKAIQVSLPVSVAFDLDKFQEVQKSILDRLGCQACCSGWDIRWDIQRHFHIDEGLNLRELG
jgi:hypothetical protein